ncbi:MAG TPA: hypothetical protein VL137_02050 [Polyangiaceae bacterium]|nr:hypothetical protein [Polyangiaceae bacterium]
MSRPHATLMGGLKRDCRFLIWAGLPLCMACAAHPNEGRPVAAGSAQVETLPRFLTIELFKDNTLKLDGNATQMNQLQAGLKAGWATGGFAEVLLWAEAGTAESTIHDVTEICLRAGISHWRFAWRGNTAGAIHESPQQPPQQSLPQQSPPQSPPQPVKAKTLGMHIGGGPNDDETRKPLLALFEKQFTALQACTRYVDQPIDKPTSFGLDLLIAVSGGQPKLSNVRTRFRSESFEACMEEVFSRMEFPAPAKRAQVISYSVVFEPISADSAH